MNKEQVLQQLAQSIPPQQLQQMVQAAETQFAQMQGFNVEDLDTVIQTLAAMLDMPDKYPQMRADLVRQGVIEEGDLPAQFSPEAVGTMLLILLTIRRKMKQSGPAMARGGLAQMARQGRGGDTMLAHISPREAMMLKAGRQPSINPVTGLQEYGWFSDIFKVIAPIALSIFMPGIGTAIGSALGASAAWAPALGGAIMGGATSALTGGDPLKGAVLGGLGGGAGEMLGSGVKEMTGLDMSPATQSGVGKALAGGAASALTGGNFLQGATQGAMGAALGNSISGLAGDATGAVGQGIREAGGQFGNLMATGASPQQALMGGALSGLMRGMRPSDMVGTRAQTGLELPPGAAPEIGSAVADTGLTSTDSGTKLGLNMQTAGVALPLLALANAPKDAKAAVKTMSPDQQEYFNRPTLVWDWDAIRRDASGSGLDLGQYIARNWNTVQSGKYNQAVPRPTGKASGGLSQVARMVRGGGSGRDDTVHARLSDGEYVMDAETVAMLGDGSTRQGANMLDQMREKLRMHKGKTLAKGNFSPNAKSPLAYMKGVA